MLLPRLEHLAADTARASNARTSSVTLVPPLHMGPRAMTDNIPAPRPLTLDVGAVETSALALHEHEDGTLYLTAQRFAVRQLELRSEALGLDFASLAVSGLAARLAKPTDGGPAYVIDASADEVRLEG